MPNLQKISVSIVIFLAIIVVLLPSSSFLDFLDYAHWLLLTTRIIADISAFLACVISILIIYKSPAKSYSTDLSWFLSLGVLSYGIISLNPIKLFEIFENIKGIVFIISSGLAFTMLTQFYLHFQPEFNLREDVAKGKDVKVVKISEKFKNWFYGDPKHLMKHKKFRNWLLTKNRLFYFTVLLIISSLYLEVSFSEGINLILVFGLFCLSATSLSLMLHYRFTEPKDKRRMFWLVYGYFWSWGLFVYVNLLVIILAIAEYDANGLNPVAISLGAVILMICITISLFITDIFDTRIVIRKTVIYGALGLLLIFLFAMLEEAAIDFLSNYFNISDRYYSIFLAGLLALAGNIISKAVEPPFGRFLNSIISDN